jgi:cytochrome c-type biogenesis protein
MTRSITYKVMSNSIAFIIGFSIIFIFVVGSLAGALTEFFFAYSAIINKVLGVIVIVLGIHVLGIFKIKSLMMEKRFQFADHKFGLFGSVLVGMAFAFGWTPCIGPDSKSYWTSLLLMTSYSLGLAIPFLLAAMALNKFLLWFNKFKHHFRTVEILSGILVILIGVMIFAGGLTQMNQYFQGMGGLESGIQDKVFGEGQSVNMLFAFIGGLISFLSPCVLPLVPMYLSYLSGVSLSDITASETKAEKSEKK